MRNTMFHQKSPEVNRMRRCQVWSAHRWREHCLDKPVCWPFFFFSHLQKGLHVYQLPHNEVTFSQKRQSLCVQYYSSLFRLMFTSCNVFFLTLSHSFDVPITYLQGCLFNYFPFAAKPSQIWRSLSWGPVLDLPHQDTHFLSVSHLWPHSHPSYSFFLATPFISHTPNTTVNHFVELTDKLPADTCWEQWKLPSLVPRKRIVTFSIQYMFLYCCPNSLSVFSSSMKEKTSSVMILFVWSFLYSIHYIYIESWKN